MIAAYIPNRVGASVHPCLIPLLVSYWVTEFPVYTQSNMHSRIQHLDDFGKTSGTFKLRHDHDKKLRFTTSKALNKSLEAIITIQITHAEIL